MRIQHLLAAAATAVATIAAPAALAHTRLENSQPAANSVVPAPAQVRLRFSDPLELPFSKVKLVDEKGAVLEASTIAVDPADAKALVATTPGLHAGAWRVQWSTVTRDGHKVKGEFGFRVK